MVVDGGSGSVVWSHSVPCHMKEIPTTSAITSDQKSVFLFWAEALTAASLSSVSEGIEDRWRWGWASRGCHACHTDKAAAYSAGVVLSMFSDQSPSEGLSGNRLVLPSWSFPSSFHQRSEHWPQPFTTANDSKTLLNTMFRATGQYAAVEDERSLWLVWVGRSWPGSEASKLSRERERGVRGL